MDQIINILTLNFTNICNVFIYVIVLVSWIVIVDIFHKNFLGVRKELDWMALRRVI